VKLQLHVSTGWYAIVANGYCDVDIRKCYSLTGVGVRPTKSGIILRQTEWRHLKEVAKKIVEKFPAVADAQACWTSADHFNREDAIAFGECNPYAILGS
jgi:predicted transglutaminase-like cysteine proteinase